MKIITSVSGPPRTAKAKALEALRRGSDLVEFRLDLMWDSLPSIDEVRRLVSGLESKVVLTWRTRKHGGRGEAPKRDWLLEIASLAALIDIEYEIAVSGVRPPNSIFSWHDLSGTPSLPELVSISEKLLNIGGVVKVVTLAKDELEAYRVLALYRQLDHSGRLVAFSMGERASFSRRLAPLLGSPFIYAFVGEPVASGQVSLDEALLLRELLS